ncbi:unnamed protein product [Chrysoparadoxa australica]
MTIDQIEGLEPLHDNWDKFIVLASDGVFEFITSDAVREAIQKFSDPLEASKFIVQEAFRQWLRYEVRTDDITIIVIYLEDFRTAASLSLWSSPWFGIWMTLLLLLLLQDVFAAEGMRPVRRYFSKEAKSRLDRLIREGGTSKDNDVDHAFDVEANAVPKSPGDRANILEVVKINFLFTHLSPEQLEDVIKVMTREDVKAGEVVIRQGDEGDKFYIVDSGSYEVSMTDHHGSEKVVSRLDSHGQSFGELSLMYGKPRTATVKATSEGSLWALSRRALRGVIAQRITHDNLIKVLRKVKVLKLLAMLKLQKICDLLDTEHFAAGETIAKQGEEGNKLYVVSSGALTFSAMGACRLLSLSRERLEASIGPLANVIAASVRVDNQKAELHKDSEKEDKILVESLNEITYDDLKFTYWAVHLGNFGFVGQFVKVSDETKAFAVKVISKSLVMEEEHTQDFIQREQAMLKGMGKPSLFVPVLLHHMQDSRCIYNFYRPGVVCSLSALLDETVMPEVATMWVGACLTLAIDHLHHEGIIQRRVTPYCVYILEDGKAQLADMGCATRMDGNKAYTIIGDREFLAPEQISGAGYGFSVDYWMLGILLYELMHGKTPFGGEVAESELYKKISMFDAAADLVYDFEASSELKSVLEGLLAKSAEKRLGYNGVQELTEHHFFKDIGWQALESGDFEAPPELLEAIMSIRDAGDRADPGWSYCTCW